MRKQKKKEKLRRLRRVKKKELLKNIAERRNDLYLKQ